jgi:hypothetical protein
MRVKLAFKSVPLLCIVVDGLSQVKILILPWSAIENNILGWFLSEIFCEPCDADKALVRRPEADLPCESRARPLEWAVRHLIRRWQGWPQGTAVGSRNTI